MSDERRPVIDVALLLPVPPAHIVYEVLHVPHPNTSDAQYESTMREFHRALHAETRALRAELGAPENAGVVWSRETRFALTPRAAAYYASLSLPVANPPRLYELAVGVDGAVNLDVLEHIVRDRIGIYRSVHGRHVDEHATFVVNARNLVHATRHAAGARHGWTAVVSCTKPFGESADFRTAFRHAIDRAQAAHGDVSLELWERKLGLGRGLDVTLRVSGLPAPDALDRVLEEMPGEAVVRASLDAAVIALGEPLALED